MNFGGAGRHVPLHGHRPDPANSLLGNELLVKNTIRDGRSTALETVYTAYTAYISSTAHRVYTVKTALEQKTIMPIWYADLKFVGTVGTGGPVKFFLAV